MRWGIVGAMAALAVAVWVAVALNMRAPREPKPTARKPVPIENRTVLQPAGLAFAKERYLVRGGRYILGRNDCSTFVCDYLKASGVTMTSRLTTRELYRPRLNHQVGLKQVAEAKPGDILVYRYGKGEGHCGIVAAMGDELVVFHNAFSARGLTAHRLDDFVHIAKSQALPKPVRVFRLSNQVQLVATQKRIALRGRG